MISPFKLLEQRCGCGSDPFYLAVTKLSTLIFCDIGRYVVVDHVGPRQACYPSTSKSSVEAGHEPKRGLPAYRSGVLALAVRSLGEGAALTVADDRHGTPRLRRRQDRPRRYVAQNANGRGVATPAQPATQEAAL